MKQHYYVSYKIEAQYTAEVVADHIKDALKQAETAFSEADFGEAQEVEGKAIVIEDESGNLIWEA